MMQWGGREGGKEANWLQDKKTRDERMCGGWQREWRKDEGKEKEKTKNRNIKK